MFAVYYLLPLVCKLPHRHPHHEYSKILFISPSNFPWESKISKCKTFLEYLVRITLTYDLTKKDKKLNQI